MDGTEKDRMEAAGKQRLDGMKKTIVFYIATLTRGGAERVIVNLANYFYGQGYEVYMVTLEPDEGLYPMADGIKKLVLDPPKAAAKAAQSDAAPGNAEDAMEKPGIISRIRAAAGRITKVRKLLRETQAQALVSFIGKTNIRAVLAAFATKTKVFVSVRSAPEREYAGSVQRLLAKLLFCFADGIVFQSEGARAFFPKAAQKRSRILYNPLSPEYVRELYRGERRNEIVTVGRMDEVKNHALLIDAFSIVAKEKPQMHLTIYGGGDCMEAIKKQVKRLGLEEKVSLPGDTLDIPDKIKDAKLFVLSSNFEGMPNAVAEAFAMGIPVVSTDCPSGGARALVRDGETGLLVPVRDAGKMAEAILKILNDSALEERLRENAYRFSQTLHPDKINRQWQEFIEETVSKA